MAHIKLDSVCIDFPIYNAKSISLRHQLIRLGTGGLIQNSANQVMTVRSLDNLNLSLSDGDRIGLMGHNGAGKSTLLRTLAGIYAPTSGTISISGNLSTVFEIGAGMDPELSGYENIVRLQIYQGVPLSTAKTRAQEIGEFTELGDFLRLPIRTYSSGMTMRLMFAVATSSNPEILLVDEMISTGDMDFQEKARERMKKIQSQSSIFVLASHSIDLIEEFCDRLIVIEHGQILEDRPLRRQKNK